MQATARQLLMTGFLWFSVLLAGCSGGAIQFAPASPPLDLSPLRYEHPGGAFSLTLPRNWAVYTQNTTELAAATFTPPGDLEPALSFSVINMGAELDALTFGELIDRYQTDVRPDASHYSEQGREAMGDGSWRLAGLRRRPGGETEALNTFVQRSGAFIAVAEVVLPDDAARLAVLERALNTFEVNPSAPLQATGLVTLSAARRSELQVVNVSSWTTADGVLFITGEVANGGDHLVMDLPVRAVLLDAEGRGVAEAVDRVMGHAIRPGEFAPFSLRFGQGQPPATASYELILGDENWRPGQSMMLLSPDELNWTDESRLTESGQLVVTGTVTNIGQQTASNLRATVTVFDSGRNVIAAVFVDIAPARLRPDDEAEFAARIPELGADPEFYIVNIQALPADAE